MTEEQAIFQRSVRVFLEKEAAPLVAVAEDVIDHGLHVLSEVASFCKEPGADGIGVDDLEIERGSALFAGREGLALNVGMTAAAAKGGKGATHHRAYDFEVQ